MEDSESSHWIVGSPLFAYPVPFSVMDTLQWMSPISARSIAGSFSSWTGRWPAIVGGLVGVIVPGLFTLRRLDYSWLPHDDGTLALAAQEVMRGKWPHLDFDTPYSGGLSLLNSALFRVGGENFITMRYGLLLVAVVSVVAAAWSLVRNVPWFVVAPAVGVSLAWSIGVYPTPMPSWYQVFLALAAGAALLAFLRSGSVILLGGAGVLVGLAVITKVTGLFTLGALLLVLGGTMRGIKGRWVLIWGPVAAGALLVAGAISWQRIFVLVVPLVLVGYAASRRVEFEVGTRVGWSHVTVLWGAALIPVGVFLAASALRGGLGEVLEGWFLTPRVRFDYAAYPPHAGVTGVAALVAPVLVFVLYRARRFGKLAGWALCLVALVVALESWAHASLMVYLGVTLTPLAVGILTVGRKLIQPLQLVWSAILAFTALLAFPASNPYYALYLVPPAAFALLAMSLQTRPESTGANGHLGPIFVTISAMALLGIGAVQGAVYRGEFVFDPPLVTTTLGLDRATFEVEEADAVYNALVPRVIGVAAGRPIYAGPDLPQVYALSGLEPVARVFFEFLTAQFDDRDLPGLLDAKGAVAIVINRSPSFSDPIPSSTMDTLQRMFPMSEVFGDFELRWKNP
jgi:hypothetical protein